jgi:hypothetical protein
MWGDIYWSMQIWGKGERVVRKGKRATNREEEEPGERATNREEEEPGERATNREEEEPGKRATEVMKKPGKSS